MSAVHQPDEEGPVVPWSHKKPLLPRALWRRHLTLREALALQKSAAVQYYTAVGKESGDGYYLTHPCSELYRGVKTPEWRKEKGS
jgi:hypothetical protein